MMVPRILAILLVSLVCIQAESDALKYRGNRSSSFWNNLEWDFFKFALSDVETKTEYERDTRLNFKNVWLAYLDYRFDEPYACELNGPGTVTYENKGFTTKCAKKKEMAEIGFWHTKQLNPLIVRIWLVDADEALWPGIKDCICSMDPFGEIMIYVRDKTQIMGRPEINPDSSLEDAKGVSVYTDFKEDMKNWGVSFNEEETLFLKKLYPSPIKESGFLGKI